MKNLGTIANDEDVTNKKYVDDAIAADTPASASINSSTGVITFKNAAGTSLFTLQLPLYNGGTS